MAEQDKGTISDTALDALFQDRAAATPDASEALMARVQEDALRERPVPGAVMASDIREGWVSRVLSAIGGWPGAGGLVTAGVVGLWIGVSPPATLETQASDLLERFSSDLTGDWGSYGDLL